LKVYAHGPNAGKTVLIGGVQFVNGEANIPKLSNRLERFYSVKDYAPVGEVVVAEKVDSTVVVAIETPVSEAVVEEDNGAELLRQVVEDKKKEIEKEVTRILRWVDFNNIGKFRAYVKEVTGAMPRTHKEGDALLNKHEGIS
jgi:hypothetical protein